VHCGSHVPLFSMTEPSTSTFADVPLTTMPPLLRTLFPRNTTNRLKAPLNTLDGWAGSMGGPWSLCEQMQRVEAKSQYQWDYYYYY
jgi:hypothetical protein